MHDNNQIDPKITIIDAVMGTGKSTWIINHIIQNNQKKFVVVLPLLMEVERYEKDLKQHRPVYAPHVDINTPDLDTKLKAFKNAIFGGAGVIVTTHGLFMLWDDETREHIERQGDYTLILDETVDPVQEADIKKDDYQLLLTGGYIREVDIPGKRNFKSISRTEKTEEYDGKLKPFIRHASRSNVIVIDDCKYIRTIKPESITAFDSCFVLTYMYPGSQMDCWFKVYGLGVSHKTLIIDDYTPELTLADHPGTYSGTDFVDKITLVETPGMNAVGKKRRKGVPLSKKWFEKIKPEQLRELKNNLANMARHLSKKFIKEVIGDDVSHPGYYFLWSVKNAYREALEKGLPYKSVPRSASIPLDDEQQETEADRACFLSHNQRATNMYAHKGCLAYLTTPLPLVPIKNFFSAHGLDYNDNTFMLSTLLQWVWRSRIRNGQEILLYIPSEPLRNLFQQWLCGVI